MIVSPSQYTPNLKPLQIYIEKLYGDRKDEKLSNDECDDILMTDMVVERWKYIPEWFRYLHFSDKIQIKFFKLIERL